MPLSVYRVRLQSDCNLIAICIIAYRIVLSLKVMHESVKEYSLERRVDAHLAEIARSLTAKRGELTKQRDQLVAAERDIAVAEKKMVLF